MKIRAKAPPAGEKRNGLCREWGETCAYFSNLGVRATKGKKDYSQSNRYVTSRAFSIEPNPQLSHLQRGSIRAVRFYDDP